MSVYQLASNGAVLWWFLKASAQRQRGLPQHQHRRLPPLDAEGCLAAETRAAAPGRLSQPLVPHVAAGHGSEMALVAAELEPRRGPGGAMADGESFEAAVRSWRGQGAGGKPVRIVHDPSYEPPP